MGTDPLSHCTTHALNSAGSSTPDAFAGRSLSVCGRITGFVRTDNDTWGITTSVGSTALFVAAARALEAQKPDPLVVDPYAEVFCRAVGGQWANVLDGKAPEDRLSSEFGEHFVNYQAARTRYFDDYFAAAAEAGARQIVLLAAGLDARAYRLPWPGGTTVFELDQPQILQFKRDVLARHGDAPKADRQEIAVDLREDWPQALLRNGFDSSKPSAWLAEGLLIYLPATAQEQLFSGIDAMSSSGSRIAVDDTMPMPSEIFEAKQAEERASGENVFFTLVYNEQHAPVDKWFSARGWAADPTRLADYLRQAGRPVPPADSEAHFMVDSLSLVSAVKRT
jgi:methyltransferase (TIGR00027 family)